MTRKQMIESIARQAGCSKRLVRKKLFNRSAELARTKYNFFTKTFLDKTIDWLDAEELKLAWRNGNKEIDPWGTPNTFEVDFFPSGCVVLFQLELIDEETGFHYTKVIGERLYNF